MGSTKLNSRFFSSKSKCNVSGSRNKLEAIAGRAINARSPKMYRHPSNDVRIP